MRARQFDKIARLSVGAPHPILMVDPAGRPVEWVSWRDAVLHYVLDQVAWTVGDPSIRVRGGMNARGLQSELLLHPVIAIAGADGGRYDGYTPPLSNAALFARDRRVCLYCGERFHSNLLSRDHVVPLSHGGPDCWENVATACRSCNQKKDARTPEQASMPLLAVPYVPSHAESLIMANRRILADQMAFLETRVPRRRREHGVASAGNLA